MQKSEDCFKDQLASIKWNIPANNLSDVLTFVGNIEIKEKLYSPIDLSLDGNRCSLDMKTCEKTPAANIRGFCSKLSDPTFLFSYAVARIVPHLSCPINAGNYTILYTEVDMKILTYFPLDGFVYNSVVKVISTDPVKKTRKLAWCGKFETKIIKERVKS